jgi:DNA helicase-2/ATP-dependent DNA helicase PcrA
MYLGISTMPSPNRVIICAAGGGKTTGIVREAFSDKQSRSALVTYTRNNEHEIQSKFFALSPAVPPHVEVMTWYVFQLQELARPYRNFMHDHRIDGLSLVEGRSVQGVPATRISAQYFANMRRIYSDKIAKFICECNKVSDGAIMKCLSNRFDHIFIDEVQDLAGYDLEVIELMLKAGIRVTLVGDHRQSVLMTNNNNKNNAFKGINIVRSSGCGRRRSSSPSPMKRRVTVVINTWQIWQTACFRTRSPPRRSMPL